MRQILSRTFAFTALAALAAPFCAAQYRFEITPHVGYRWGGTVDLANTPTAGQPNVPLYNKFSVQGSSSYGVGGGYYITPNALLDFDWTRQGTAVDARRVSGTTDHSVADFTLNTYHFGLMYHFREPEAKLRPYFRVGLGWTSSRPEIQGVDSYNRFSAAVGGGVKYFVTRNIGVRAQIQYMPAFVYSTTDGVWCGWYGCWTSQNNHYLHQGDASVGVSLRF